MDDFHAKTCVRFREKTAQDTHWIRIVKDDGCYSMIGRQPRSGTIVEQQYHIENKQSFKEDKCYRWRPSVSGIMVVRYGTN